MTATSTPNRGWPLLFVILPALASFPTSAQTLFTSQEYRLADSYPRDGIADTSLATYGAGLRAGFDETTGAEWRAFFEFDISSLTSAVDSATFTLRLDGYYVGSTWTVESYSANNSIDLSNWDTAGTFQDSIALGETFFTDFIHPFDVTSGLNQAISAGSDYFGLRLSGSPEEISGYGQFSSSSYSPANDADRPQISYSLSAVPEPGALGAIIGLIVLSFTITFRKRPFPSSDETSRFSLSAGS